jgi:hypothetical protein
LSLGKFFWRLIIVVFLHKRGIKWVHIIRKKTPFHIIWYYVFVSDRNELNYVRIKWENAFGKRKSSTVSLFCFDNQI